MIFISYSWADSQAVHTLKWHLARAGCDAWIDFENLDLNTPLEAQVRQAVHDASRVLLLDSPHSRCSSWVTRELAWAQGAGIEVINWPVEVVKEQLGRPNNGLHLTTKVSSLVGR